MSRTIPPPLSDRGRCRDCGAEVFWASTSNGKRMPIEILASPEGRMVLVAGDGHLFAWRSGPPYPVPANTPLRCCHFDVCPDRQPKAAAAVHEREPQYDEAAGTVSVPAGAQARRRAPGRPFVWASRKQRDDGP